MQIYIGNLNEMTTAHHLVGLFLPFGGVNFPRIMRDEKTGKSLRYGFIEMDASCAKKAILQLNRFLFMNFYVEVVEMK